MFREMRRKSQKLSDAECAKLLSAGTSGVLALLGDGDYPYAVPLSYVYEKTDDTEKIYFHSALTGHKLDAIRKQEKASFCVIAQDTVVSEKYTTYYRSVIAFGKIRVLDTEQEKQRAAEMLAEKYVPTASAESHSAEIDRFWDALCMLELKIEHLSGKAAKELVSGGGAS